MMKTWFEVDKLETTTCRFKIDVAEVSQLQ